MLVESGVAALVLASCGEKPEPRVPVRPTPTQSKHLNEPDSGDEAGVKVVVHVRVSRTQVRVRPARVAAFLPLRFSVANATKRKVFVHIAGQPALQLGPGLSASQESPGEKAGRIRISAGRLHGFVRVKPGG